MARRKRASRTRAANPRRKTTKPTTAPEQDGPRTAKNTRPKLRTGSIDDVRSLYPAQPDTSDVELDAAKETLTQFDDATVRQAYDLVRKTGILEKIQPLMEEQKVRPGRPAHFSPLSVLVSIALAAHACEPLNGTDLSRLLDRRIPAPWRSILDVTRIKERPETPRARRLWDEARARAWRNAFHRFLHVVDPSLLPKNRLRTWDEIERLKRDLSIEEQAELNARLDWVCGQILDAAIAQAPEPVRRRMRAEPAYCIDGTPLPLFARGRSVNSTEASSDPDGGYYYRATDARNLDDDDPRLKFSRKSEKKRFCREIHLVVTADITHPERLYFPALPISMTTEVPAVDPSGSARRALANLVHRGHPTGYLSGDLLYTQQAQRKYQVPAREAGFNLVLAYGPGETGVQASHPSGMQLIDGNWYPPCTPADLVDVFTDLREKRIDHAQFKQLIERRAEYRMRTQQKPTQDKNERLVCPAAGKNPTAICALKKSSQNERPIRHPDGSVIDIRRVIDHTIVNSKHKTTPQVCEQRSVTVTPDQGGKYRQTLPYGSDRHAEIYKRTRQSQEGLHGTAKDTAEGALGTPGRRRIRGKAAQAIYAAFLLAAVTTRKLVSFLNRAEPDENGDLYVPRSSTKRRRDRIPPSGTAPPHAA